MGKGTLKNFTWNFLKFVITFTKFHLNFSSNFAWPCDLLNPWIKYYDLCIYAPCLVIDLPNDTLVRNYFNMVYSVLMTPRPLHGLKLKRGCDRQCSEISSDLQLSEIKMKCHAHATKVHKVLRVFTKYPIEAFYRNLLNMRSESHLCKAATEISLKASGF